MATSPRRVRSRSSRIAILVVGILVIAPPWVVAAVVALRSELFNIVGGPLSPEQLPYLWTFVASGLAATVSFLGLLLTRNQSRQAERRLLVDSAVKGIELVKNDDGTYAPKASIAGALASLVHLGHPLIAMRTLAAAWEDGAVDSSSATWLINEVLEGGSEQGQIEAARLFRGHAAELCHLKPNSYDLPAIFNRRWRSSLPLEAREALIDGLCIVLVSKEKAWWLDGYRWAAPIFESVVLRDRDNHVRSYAAEVLKVLTDGAKDERRFVFDGEERSYAQMKQTAQRHKAKWVFTDPGTENYISDIRRWISRSGT